MRSLSRTKVLLAMAGEFPATSSRAGSAGIGRLYLASHRRQRLSAVRLLERDQSNCRVRPIPPGAPPVETGAQLLFRRISAFAFPGRLQHWGLPAICVQNVKSWLRLLCMFPTIMVGPSASRDCEQGTTDDRCQHESGARFRVHRHRDRICVGTAQGAREHLWHATSVSASSKSSF